MRVEVDVSRCDGFGYCEQQAPDLFRLDDDDNLLVLQSEVPLELGPRLEAATRACPVAALRIVG